jgi:ribosomal protein S27AE
MHGVHGLHTPSAYKKVRRYYTVNDNLPVIRGDAIQVTVIEPHCTWEDGRCRLPSIHSTIVGCVHEDMIEIRTCSLHIPRLINEILAGDAPRYQCGRCARSSRPHKCNMKVVRKDPLTTYGWKVDEELI